MRKNRLIVRADRTCPKCGQILHLHAGAFGTHVKYCGRDYFPVLMARVDKEWPGGCWQWMGARQRDGYAHFTLAGKTISAHRYVYERLVGPIPEGMDLLHSCDNRSCVYPGHLSPGTHTENMLDAKAKRRHAHGERGRAKITEALAKQLISEFKFYSRRRTNAKELAAKHGLRNSLVYNVGTGRSWKHLHPPENRKDR